MSALGPFDYFNAICVNKNDLMTGTDNDELAENSYVPYLVNRGLSFFPDTILYANEMNKLNFLDKKLQFHYLLNSIRPRKRFNKGKWFNNELDEEIAIISEYFKYSKEKAEDVRKILSKEQLNLMKQKLEKGGLKKEKNNDS